MKITFKDILESLFCNCEYIIVDEYRLLFDTLHDCKVYNIEKFGKIKSPSYGISIDNKSEIQLLRLYNAYPKYDFALAYHGSIGVLGCSIDQTDNLSLYIGYYYNVLGSKLCKKSIKNIDKLILKLEQNK